MSEVKKEYINADDKYVAYREVYINANETESVDPYVYKNVELTEKITKDELADAFFKRCIVAGVMDGDVSNAYVAPSGLQFDDDYAVIRVDETEYYSSEYDA